MRRLRPRRGPVWSPHRREWRRALAVVFGATLLAGLLWFLGALEPRVVRRWLPVPRLRGRAAPALPPAPHAVLARRVAGLRLLAAAAREGRLFAPAPHRAVVALHGGVVESLLRTHLPATHVLDGRFAVQLVGARVDFDDGLALVRLDGRVSLAADPDVHADLVVFGDLGVSAARPDGEVLRGRVRVVGVEARRVDVGLRAREVDRLIEQVGRARLEDLARLGPDLDIPVRARHTFEVGGVGPRGPVRIDPAEVAVTVQLANVSAYDGRLWVAVDVTAGDGPVAADAAMPRRVAADPPPGTPEALRAEHRVLREAVEAGLEQDPTVRSVRALEADLVLVIPTPVATGIGEEVARRSLDQVRLDLRDIDVEREGERQAGTAFGRIRAGRWRLRVEVDRVTGVLRAGRPSLRVSGPDRVAVEVPVQVEGGRGEAALTFEWDSTGLANLVCRDFTVRERVEAAVPPGTHVMRGSVRLDAEGDRLRLAPAAERRYRIAIEPTADAWARARRALEAQDRIFRCGLGLHPPRVMAELERLVARGVPVRLPRRIFRPLAVRMAATGTLDVAGLPVTVSASGSRLVLEPERVVFGTRLAVARAR